jgi:hypothetical protein
MMVINPFMVAPGLVVALSPNPSNASRGTSGTLSTVMTATPAGGSGTYTYSWSIIDNGGGTPSLTNGTTAAVTCSMTAAAADGAYAIVVRCTVTDTVTAATAAADGTFNYTWT